MNKPYTVIEFTFLRNDRLTYNKIYSKKLSLPYKLDFRYDFKKKIFFFTS